MILGLIHKLGIHLVELLEELFILVKNFFFNFVFLCKLFFYFLGLMLTSTLIFKILNFINFTIDIREICVFLAPIFSSFTVLATYLFTKEVQVKKKFLFVFFFFKY